MTNDFPELPSNLHWLPFDDESREFWNEMLRIILTDEDAMPNLAFQHSVNGKHAVILVIGEDISDPRGGIASEGFVAEHFNSAAVRECFDLRDAEDPSSVILIIARQDGAYLAGVGGGSFN